MIACPVCNGETVVTETRQTAPDQARRRRLCRAVSCGKKITTIEVVVGNGNTKHYAKGPIAIVSRRDLERILGLITNALTGGTNGEKRTS